MLKKILNNYMLPVIRDPHRKPFFQMARESIDFALKKKTTPLPYFTRLLYKDYTKNYLDYVSNKTVFKLEEILNDSEYIALLENKYIYQEFYKDKGVSLPHMLAINYHNIFWQEGRHRPIDDLASFEKIIEEMFDKCENRPSIFIKPISGTWGKDTFKVDKSDDLKKKIAEIFPVIKAGDFIFQETLSQHPLVDEVYPHSINTIRIDTYRNDKGESKVISAYFRIGAKGNFVDNVSLGGLFVGIDPATGRLKKYASSLIYSGAPIYETHPDTHFRFENVEVPFYKETKELVEKAAGLLPGIRLVGWDVVITEKGPLLLEGNHDYHMGVLDIAYGGYHNNPVFKEMVVEAGLNLDEA